MLKASPIIAKRENDQETKLSESTNKDDVKLAQELSLRSRFNITLA